MREAFVRVSALHTEHVFEERMIARSDLGNPSFRGFQRDRAEPITRGANDVLELGRRVLGNHCVCHWNLPRVENCVGHYSTTLPLVSNDLSTNQDRLEYGKLFR